MMTMTKIDLRRVSKYWAIDPDTMAAMTEPQSGLSLLPNKPLENTRRATIRDGVAIIPITGVLTPRFDIFTALSGGTAMDELARDIQSALDNTNVRSILLDIDSPGGAAVGTSEMAEIIHNASQVKPIWAYVGRNCCSAAYWLASAANRIVAHKSAILGSIGVVSIVPVQEKPDADGYRYHEIVSSNAQNKRPDPRSAQGLETIRAELDAIEKDFIACVAQYRNTSEDTVKTKFGGGGVLIGNDAVVVGMADELSTYEQTIKKLNQGDQTMSTPQANITVEYLAENHPDIVAAIQAQGAASERDRILALDEIATAGYSDLLAAAKADPTMTAEKLAVEIVRAEKSKGASHIAALKKADEEMPNVAPTVDPKSESVGATAEERATHEWNTKADVRAEFDGDKDAYVAFKVAQENGQIKIQTKGK